MEGWPSGLQLQIYLAPSPFHLGLISPIYGDRGPTLLIALRCNVMNADAPPAMACWRTEATHAMEFLIPSGKLAMQDRQHSRLQENGACVVKGSRGKNAGVK